MPAIRSRSVRAAISSSTARALRLARTVWGDPDRYRDSYWSRFWKQGYFFSGDGAKWDADGDIWVLGRVDDVINVSGHRLSTIEIESSLVAHPAVAEAGVVGVADALTGQAIAAYIIPTVHSTGPEAEASGLLAGTTRRADRTVAVPCLATDRSDRQTARRHSRTRSAENPVGKDHEATARRHLRRAAAGRRDEPAGRDGSAPHPRRSIRGSREPAAHRPELG